MSSDLAIDLSQLGGHHQHNCMCFLAQPLLQACHTLLGMTLPENDNCAREQQLSLAIDMARLEGERSRRMDSQTTL
jgi:hypothetical protein